MPVRLLIADDHPLFRGALRQAMGAAFPDAVIGEAGDFTAAMRALTDHPETDLVLLDLTMPGAKGLSGLLSLRAEHPGVPVVVVSGNDDAAIIRRCLDFGASGFIPKTASLDDMRGAVANVLEGGVWLPPGRDLPMAGASDDLGRRFATLTPQQLRVLGMVRDGLLNKQIAYELSVSEATIKAHVSAILQKLGVDSRTQAVIAASKLEQGFSAE